MADGELVLGARGDLVAGMQAALHKLGVQTGADPIGVFGSATEAAVRRLQLRYGLPVTGKVDAATRAIFQSALGHLGDTAGVPAASMLLWTLIFGIGTLIGYKVKGLNKGLGSAKSPSVDPKDEAHDTWRWYERRVQQAREIGLPPAEVRDLERRAAEYRKRFESL